MGTRAKWLACGIIVGLMLTPAMARAQTPNVGDPPWQFPLPTMLDYKESGLYFAAEALWMRPDNPLEHQVLAVRGVVDDAGLIRGRGAASAQECEDDETVIVNVFEQPGVPGWLLGSGQTALETDMADGENYEPGWRLTLGYRFRNDVAVEAVYWKLTEARSTAAAGILPPLNNFGREQFDSFLYAKFFNFSKFFAGPSFDVVGSVDPDPNLFNEDGDPIIANQPPGFCDAVAAHGGPPVPAFGIWNGAEEMTIELVQRMYNFEINARFPVLQTDCIRLYSTIGPRHFNLYERFKFLTIDQDLDLLEFHGASYVNEWENRLYGVQWGGGSELYLGAGFSFMIDTKIGIFADLQHTNVKVQREDVTGFVQQRANNETHVAPMFQVGAYVYWFPIEGVQVRAGYEFLGLFNLLRAEKPVDFNLGTLSPDWEEHDFFRLDGWNVGVAFIF